MFQVPWLSHGTTTMAQSWDNHASFSMVQPCTMVNEALFDRGSTTTTMVQLQYLTTTSVQSWLYHASRMVGVLILHW